MVLSAMILLTFLSSLPPPLLLSALSKTQARVTWLTSSGKRIRERGVPKITQAISI